MKSGGNVYRFLIFYFVAYGGAHLYFYLKLKRALHPSRKWNLIISIYLLTIFLSPVIARNLESSGLDSIQELLSSAGYLWMGLLFLFVTAAAFIDTINCIVSLVRSLAKKAERTTISPKALFLASAAYAALIGIYGYFEARDIRTEHLAIKSNRIPPGVSRVRIVQLSDVHIGQVVREARIKDILKLVRAAEPDILVSTGDLVDGHQKHFSGIEKLFLEVRPRLGKFAIMGNHEYYVGIEKSIAFTKESGFKVLLDENFELGGLISITGIDDSRNREERTAHAALEKKLLQAAPSGIFRLLLKHRPIVEKDSGGKFDLQLSGHTHKGQIFPFNFLTWLSFPVKTGLTRLKEGGWLYVSRGTGVWGPPIRFLAPPEITVIDLVPESAINTKN